MQRLIECVDLTLAMKSRLLAPGASTTDYSKKIFAGKYQCLMSTILSSPRIIVTVNISATF